jgi:lipopolysaccharide transport system ATP-binding protein
MNLKIKICNGDVFYDAIYEKSLRSQLTKKNNLENKTIKALEKINLKIYQKDRIALIGDNGSGKTTLLKVIANIIPLTNGQIDIDGKVFCLIDPNMGLEPECTGIENIFLVSALNFIPKKFIKEQIDEIIEFSGLNENIFRDVKTYSAGMKTRLAVSIIVNSNPDIFVCDEFISAGDKNFKEKLEIKMKKLIENSGVFIVATHDHEMINKFCNRILTLHQGKIIKDERI